MRVIALGLVVLAAFCSAAGAATINILAIGASNTAGRGVSDSEAWPAMLESMLRSKGYDAHVTVRAANGLTSTQIVSYADSIPEGTKIVIFDTGISNDRNRNISFERSRANVAELMRRIRAHGAVPIPAPYGKPGFSGPGYPKQADGVHFAPAGHRMIAARLVPRVIAAAHAR
jgi:acyl-CoA thioesterase-1